MKLKAFTILFLLIFFLAEPSVAQCPMCKAAAESSLKEGSTMAIGLNKGILYLLSMPYLLISGIFLVWYWNYRKNKVVVS